MAACTKREGRVLGFFTHPPARHADHREIKKMGNVTTCPNVELNFQLLCRSVT